MIKLSLTKKIAILVSLFSLFTIVYNTIRYVEHGRFEAMLAIVQGSVGLVFFIVSFFIDTIAIKISQLAMCLIVAMTTLYVNQDPTMGIFFLCVCTYLAVGHKLFHMYPIPSLTILIGIVYAVFLRVIPDGQKSTSTTLGMGLICAMIWVITSSLIQDSRNEKKELKGFVARTIELLKEIEKRDSNANNT